MSAGERFYVTPSRISRALECGLKYRRQFVEKLEPTTKPGLAMFAGDMQHKALEKWGGAGGDLLEIHRDMWFEHGPAELVWSKNGKTEEAHRHFSPLGLFLHYDEKVAAVVAAEAALEAEIAAERPDLKKVRSSKEWRERAPKLDGTDNRTRLEKTKAIVDTWYRAGKSPWRVVQYEGPLEAFVADREALAAFVWWWSSFAEDERPDIVHTESKERIPLGEHFTVTGVIDAVYLWPDGSVEVVDYKRSRGKEDPVAHFVQAAVYARTCREVIGLEPSHVTFHHLKDRERLRFEVRPDWTDRLIELAERVRRMHELDDFAPSFRTCSWCDYVDMCRERFAFVAEVVPTATIEGVE